ncbi:MAG: hypothetical protein ACHQ0J_11145 [Candidatus Dormibacterales bacterium]
MTGATPETWRKFRFTTAPAWTYVLLILVCLGGLGVIVYAIVASLVSNRATGFLPLTKTSKRTVDLVTWTPLALLGAWLVLWFAALLVGCPATDPGQQTTAWVLFWMGTLCMLAGLIGRLVVMPLVSPRATVMEQLPGQYDKLVELKRVHPAFVAAVNAMHQSRAAQYAAASSAASLPLQPNSN